MKTIQKEFIEQCIFRLKESFSKIATCLDLINEEQVWYRPNESLNSIGNLMLHLCGNIRQYAISSLGNLPDNRERDLEFSTEGGFTKNELKEKLHSTLDEAFQTINALEENSLMKFRSVQGFSFSGIGIIIHVTEHLSYHTGQIIFLVKLIKNKDLGFYAGINLNEKNK